MKAQLRFQQFDITAGLSQNSVNKVFKDSEGYYWFGTHDGLNRYDGNTFEVFRHNRADSTTLSDNFVLDIAEDKFGQLWIGTRHCLNRFSKSSELFQNITRTPQNGLHAGHNSILKLEFDKEGNLYYSAIGKLFRISQNELEKSVPLIDTIMDMNGCFAIDENDVIHVMSSGCYYKCPVKLLTSIKNHKLFCQEKTAACGNLGVYALNGKILIVSCQGLFEVDEVNKKLNSLFADELKNKGIYSVYRHTDKTLWVATDKGLYIGDTISKTITRVRSKLEYPYSLRSEHIVSFSQTSDSLLWVGSTGNGVFVHDLKHSGFSFVNRYTHPELNSDNFSSAYIYNGKLYCGNSKGIAVFDDSFKLVNQFVKDDVVSDLAITKDGRIWAATADGLILLSKNGTLLKRINKSNSILASDKLFSLYYASESEIWLASQSGLYKYDAIANKTEYVKCSTDQTSVYLGYILSVNKDSDGQLWVCHNYGVSVFKNKSEHFINYHYSENSADSISHRLNAVFFEDSKKRKWIGTLGGGLNLFDETKNKFKNFTISDGICSDFITSISEDASGLLWLGSGNGISSLDADNMKFKNYFVADGLIGNEVSWNGMQILPNGKLVAAGPTGLNILELGKISEPVKLTSPVIKSVLVNNENLKVNTDSILLDDNHNRILLELAFPDLRQKNNVLFEYMLSGIDTNYIRLPSGQRTISFANIPYGKYTLHIRVADDKDRAYSDDIKLTIAVTPPFWKTNVFYALLVFTGFSVLISAIIIITRKKHREEIKKIEIEHKVYLERDRISRDLHDNIGSQLTYIISNLDYLKYKFENKPAEDHQAIISELGIYARNTVQQLRDTIWAISGEKITVDEFSHRVKSYLVNFLSLQKDLTFLINVNGKADQELSPAQLLNLFRIIQEAVNNIVKHASASRIDISFTAAKQEIMVQITDNGKGFLQRKQEGYGINNMEYRVKNINGTIDIKSEEGKGTRIEIKCPIEKLTT